MKSWSITTVDRPLIGISHDAPDGAENVTIFRVGGEWRMIYSEGLAHQHLAAASSPDLVHWNVLGKLAIPPQSWMRVKHGAPVVWQEHGRYRMLLMGEDAARHTTLGLLESADAVHWTSLPERRSPSQ